MKSWLTLTLLAILTIAMPVQAGQEGWEKLENCRLVPNAYADGDSFHVISEGKEIIARLYFVDCPESDNSIPSRVDEQAAHFGKTAAETIEIGKYATKVTAQVLSKRFSALTRFQDARGRSAMPRYYAFITTSDGKDLGEILLENGLAWSVGMPANPPGQSSTSLKARYDLLEARAKRAKYGIYSPEPLKAITRAEPNATPSALDRFLAAKTTPTPTPTPNSATPSTQPAPEGIFAGFNDLGSKTATVSTPSLESPKPDGTPSPGEPDNHSKRWTTEEEQQLRAEVESGKTIEEIAAIHGRTPGAVKARIKKLEANAKP